MEKIFIWWIQGVGKTTIIKELVKSDPTMWSFSFWETMKKIAQKEKWYQWLHLLSDAERNIIIKKTNIELEKILLEEYFDKILFDNHFTIVRDVHIKNAFVDEKIKFYHKILLISSNTEDIISRILQDPDKERVPCAKNKDFIEKHQAIEIERAEYLSKTFNIPLFHITNKDLFTTLSDVKKLILW